MDYEIDLCPTHHCIRLTVSAETLTNELAEEIYKHLVELTSEGGPYAAIFDLSTAKSTTISTDTVRSWGRHRPPAIPMGSCPFCGDANRLLFTVSRMTRVRSSITSRGSWRCAPIRPRLLRWPKLILWFQAPINCASLYSVRAAPLCSNQVRRARTQRPVEAARRHGRYRAPFRWHLFTAPSAHYPSVAMGRQLR